MNCKRLFSQNNNYSFSYHYSYYNTVWLRRTCVSLKEAETLWSMHRWYLEDFANLYLFVSKRLSRKLFCWLVPWVCERESKEDDKFPWYLGVGPTRGTAGHAESPEARGHRSGALRADYTLLLPYRPQDVWQWLDTDGGVCVCDFTDVIFGYVKCDCKVGTVNVSVGNRTLDCYCMFASVLHWNICTTLLHMQIALWK